MPRWRTPIRIALLALLFAAAACNGKGIRLGGGANPSLFIYVAPDGDDNNPGTLALPLRTVGKARDMVRSLNSAMTVDVNVIMRGGTYPQASTLGFTSADSGKTVTTSSTWRTRASVL